mmetsp:Transcript_15782/g.28075  ORF Transcript_15782/g.28075 Transcript_15782/m.28075 type:complete len:203 (-) Transcript_15782:878-1486(-)
MQLTVFALYPLILTFQTASLFTELCHFHAKVLRGSPFAFTRLCDYPAELFLQLPGAAFPAFFFYREGLGLTKQVITESFDFSAQGAVFVLERTSTLLQLVRFHSGVLQFLLSGTCDSLSGFDLLLGALGLALLVVKIRLELRFKQVHVALRLFQLCNTSLGPVDIFLVPANICIPLFERAFQLLVASTEHNHLVLQWRVRCL